MPYYTAADALNHLLDFTNGFGNAISNRKALRATQAAYRDLINAGPWSYFLREFRIAQSAPDTANATYTHTGGTYARQLVRGSGSYPSWAKYGRAIIAGVHYEVEDSKTSNTLTLTADSNPGADVASSSVTLYRDTYQMPADFISSDLLFEFSSNDGLQYMHPNDFVQIRKKIERAGDSKLYTIVGDRDEIGRLQMRFIPYPSTAKNLDGMYFRRPRDIAIQEYSLGQVSITGGATTLTGTGVTWTADMVGSIIRINPTGEEFGSGSLDSNPSNFERTMIGGRYSYERRIAAFTNSTTLELDSAIPVTLASVKHLISDPIEIELGVMQTAFERILEHQWAVQTRNPYIKESAELWPQALQQALASDNRSMAMKRHLGQSTLEQRMGDSPIGAV